mgnify:FL=1
MCRKYTYFKICNLGFYIRNMYHKELEQNS